MNIWEEICTNKEMKRWTMFDTVIGGAAAQPVMLVSPTTSAFVDTQENGELVRSMAPVKKILDIAREANVALLGVGTVNPEASRFVQFTALSAEDLKHIAEGCGGVGEISAHVYDIEGRACAKEYAERVIGLTLAEIKQIPYRIGVAASAAKARPIYGALRGGFLHALITDEAAARGVLELFDENFRKIH